MTVAMEGMYRSMAFGLAVWSANYLGSVPALGLLSPASSASSSTQCTDDCRTPRMRTVIAAASEYVLKRRNQTGEESE